MTNSDYDKPEKPFPYFPPQISKEELIRNQLMIELNMWAYNDEYIAKQKAAIFVDVLKKQFSLE